jgi:hypothetical protein
VRPARRPHAASSATDATPSWRSSTRRAPVATCATGWVTRMTSWSWPRWRRRSPAGRRRCCSARHRPAASCRPLGGPSSSTPSRGGSSDRRAPRQAAGRGRGQGEDAGHETDQHRVPAPLEDHQRDDRPEDRLEAEANQHQAEHPDERLGPERLGARLRRLGHDSGPPSTCLQPPRSRSLAARRSGPHPPADGAGAYRCGA